MINFENNPRDPLVTEENMYNFFPKQEKIGRAKDLTNLQFGELLVLYKTDSQKIGNATKPM